MKLFARSALVAALVIAGLLASASGAFAKGRTSPGCSDSWKTGASGSWDTGSNWSTGIAPGASDTVCITAAGTYTVTAGNETITVASLTMGGTGSNPTLAIGNSGSGSPNITVTGAISNAAGSTISFYGSGGTFSAGSMTNAGTFEVPSEPYTSRLTFGNVSNTGTFADDAGSGATTLTLNAGTTFDNAGGTISNVSGDTFAIASSGSPAATLQLDSGGLVNNAGTLTMAGTVQVNGGTICGNALTVGSADGGTGGSLNFASTSGTGPTCTGGAASDQIFIANVAANLSGTIPAAYTVALGDGGPSFNTTTLQSNVINDGTFDPGYGATVENASGNSYGLTNDGTIVVPNTQYVTNLNVPLTNAGKLTLNSGSDVGPTDASLANGTSWSNTSTGTITIGSGLTLSLSSPSGQTATFTQAGLIDNSGTLRVADGVTINGGTICGNALDFGSGDGGTGGTLTFAAKPVKGPACAKGVLANHVFIYNVTATLASNLPSGYTLIIGDGGSSYAHVATLSAFTNSGTLEPGFGATFTVPGDLTNKGTITVPKSQYTTALDVNNLVNDGTVTVDGAVTATLGTGDTLTNGANHKLTLATGALSVNDPVVNDGTVTIDPPETLDVNENGSTPSTYTQASTATLADPIGSKGVGLLDVSGAATLAGAANLTAGTFVPAYHKAYTFIDDASSSGTFATVTGPYTITYGSTTVQAIGQPTATEKLSPTSGTPPVKVKVTGGGYEVGETVEIYLDSTSSTPLGSAKASSAGAISATVTIPSGTSTGTHSVITLGQTSGQTASAVFTVNGSST